MPTSIRLRPRGFPCLPTACAHRGSCGRADFGRFPAREATHRTIQALEQYMPPSQVNLVFEDGMLFKLHGASDRGQKPGSRVFQRALLSCGAARLPQVIDTTFMIAATIQGFARSGGCSPLLPRLEVGTARISTRGRSFTRIITGTNFLAVPRPYGSRDAGVLGERIVFERYLKEVFEGGVQLDRGAQICPEGRMGSGVFEKAAHLLH